MHKVVLTTLGELVSTEAKVELEIFARMVLLRSSIEF